MSDMLAGSDVMYGTTVVGYTPGGIITYQDGEPPPLFIRLTAQQKYEVMVANRQLFVPPTLDGMTAMTEEQWRNAYDRLIASNASLQNRWRAVKFPRTEQQKEARMTQHINWVREQHRIRLMRHALHAAIGLIAVPVVIALVANIYRLCALAVVGW
jgi:hypothetical protein